MIRLDNPMSDPGKFKLCRKACIYSTDGCTRIHQCEMAHPSDLDRNDDPAA